MVSRKSLEAVIAAASLANPTTAKAGLASRLDKLRAYATEATQTDGDVHIHPNILG
jgi:hypothetical protein